MATKRNYKKEYATYQGKPAQRAMGLKVGDRREVDHIKPISKGGTNKRSNLRVVSRTTNRRKGNRTK